MSYISKTLAVLMATLIVAACSSKDSNKADKPLPIRTVESSFKTMTLVQSKNSLMGACSTNHLQIQSTQTEVLCLQNDIRGSRQRDVERVVDDEYATKIQIVMQFKLQQKDGNVSVIANTYAQYLAPVSVMSGLQPRTKNLLDDLSFDAMKAILLQAGASN